MSIAKTTTETKLPFVEMRRRNLVLTFTITTAALSAGLVYGWPALRRTLVVNEQSSLTEAQFGMIFTAGSWSNLSAQFFAGLARDHISGCGTRTTACVCLLAALAGTLGIAFCGESNFFVLLLSMFGIGISSGAFLVMLPVAGLFSLERQGTILSSFSGGFQISGLVFLLLAAISSDRRASFGGFSVVLGFLILGSFYMLPKDQFVKWEWEADKEKESEKEYLSVSVSENDIEGDVAVTVPSKTRDDDVSDYKAPMDTAILDQIRSWEYSFLLLWFSVQLIPLQYYVATIGLQLERKGDDDGTYTNIFSILFASSAIAAPLIGKITDMAGLGISQALASGLNSLSMVILGLESVPLPAHIVGLVCYDLGRMMTFGTFFTNIGKRFGYTNYGTLAGLGSIVSAILSLIQYPLTSLAIKGHANSVNFVCGVIMTGVGLPYCYWLWRRERAEYKMTESMK